MRHIPLLFACAAGLAAQSYRIRTVAGPGVSPDDVPATSVQFRNISSLAEGPDGRIYLADSGDHRIREIGTDGIIRTIAGTGVAGSANGRIDSPSGLVADGCNSLYFLQREAGGFSGAIWRIDTATRALSAVLIPDRGIRFKTLSSRGNCELLATDGSLVYRLRDGGLETVAGGGDSPEDNIPARQALLEPVTAISGDPSGGVWIVERSSRIRRVDPVTGILSTFAGALNATAPAREGESALGRALTVFQIAAAPDGSVYVTSGNVLRLEARTAVVTIFAGGGDAPLAGGAPARGADTTAQALAAGTQGSVFFADLATNLVARVAEGRLTVIAGRRADGLRATDAIVWPLRVALGGGAFFLMDNSTLFRVGPDGILSRLAQPRVRWDNFLAADEGGNAYSYDLSSGSVIRVRPDGALSPVRPLGAAAAAAPGWDGSVYFQTRSGGSRLQRYRPDTETISVVQDLNNPFGRFSARTATRLAVDGKGAAYLDAGGGSVFPLVIRILGGEAEAWRSPVPSAIAADAAGNTYYSGEDFISRMTPDRFEYPLAVLRSFTLSSDRDGRLLAADGRRVLLLEPGPPPRFLFPAAGGGQTRPPGAKAWLTALLLDRDGLPYGGGFVDFTVTSGAATLNPARLRTGGDGSATVELTLGTAAGPVTVEARAGDLPPVEFRLNVAAQLPAGTPVINTGGIAGAGLASPPLRAFAAGGILSVFAANAAPAGTNRRVGADDLSNGQAPENFAGTCILVGGQRAPVFAVTETQVNFQAPDILPGRYPVRLIRNCGMPGELVSDPQFVDIAAAAPEFFYFPARPGECRPIAAVDAATGALIGAPGSIPGVETRPARPGQVLSLFLQGLGQTEPAVAAGAVSPLAAEVRNATVVAIGGREAEVLYAGRTPNNPGLYQLNMRLPRVETSVARVDVEIRGPSARGCLAYQP